MGTIEAIDVMKRRPRASWWSSRVLVEDGLRGHTVAWLLETRYLTHSWRPTNPDERHEEAQQKKRSSLSLRSILAIPWCCKDEMPITPGDETYATNRHFDHFPTLAMRPTDEMSLSMRWTMTSVPPSATTVS